MALDEIERPAPRVVGGFREVLLLAVEEAVGRSFVRDELVLDPCGLQRALELGVVLGGDVLIVAGLRGEDGRVDSARVRRRAGNAVALAGHPVEADRARETVPGRRREPR